MIQLSNGLSLWNSDPINPQPVVCKCGYTRKIGGNGGKEASFFFNEHLDIYMCENCGKMKTVGSE